MTYRPRFIARFKPQVLMTKPVGTCAALIAERAAFVRLVEAGLVS